MSNDERLLAWDVQLDALDYYQLLGLPRDATPREELAAYHRFALLFHPDRRDTPNECVARALTRIFQRGVEAHQVLSNERYRKAYEAALLRGERRLSLDDGKGPPRVNLDVALPALHHCCRSAFSKLYAQKAARAWSKSDAQATEQALRDALHADGDANPDIAACLRALEGS